jgi:hypothetical protein
MTDGLSLPTAEASDQARESVEVLQVRASLDDAVKCAFADQVGLLASSRRRQAPRAAAAGDLRAGVAFALRSKLESLTHRSVPSFDAAL